LRVAYSEVIPPWHFVMMNDAARNAAYDAALRRAAKGKRVLDIGTGAGLLAMMAARAGAAEVVSCEQVPLIAKAARDIVARNGFAERIAVIGRTSTQLALGRDLPGPAEVLVTETFSSGLLGEDVLPTIEHARANLLSVGAQIIPCAAGVRGYLVGGEGLRDKLFVGAAAGFDLAPFAAFAPAKIGLSLDHEPHEILSDDVDLLTFDLMQTVFPETRVEHAIRVTRAGTCLGVAQWLKLGLDEETSYENRPSAQANGATWAHIVYRFPRARAVEAGDVVRVAVRHDRKQISIDLL
jgi:type II protein arginine methyltransferase